MKRFLPWLAAAALAGCGPAVLAPGDAGADANADAQPPQLTRQLAFVPGAPLQLEPGVAVDLAVSLTDFQGAPVPDADVRLALLGNVLDAAISQPRARTGDTGVDAGVARATLRAPSDSATFRVRASAAQAADVYLDVSVSARGFGGISAAAGYAGARQPVQLEVDLFAAVDCAHVGAADPVRSATLPPTGATVHFGPLAAGGSFAVRANAVGTDGSVLATGCDDGLTVVRDQDVAATIPFQDEPLRASGAYACDLRLSLAGVTALTLPQWSAAVGAALGGASDAAYLLDAIGDAVERRSGAVARADFDRAVRGGLGDVVADDLVARGAGPTPVLGSLAGDVAVEMADLPGSLSLSVNTAASGRMTASTGAFTLTLDPLTPEVATDDAQLSLGGGATGDLAVGAGDRAAITLRGMNMPVPRIASAAEQQLLARLGVASTAEWLRIVTDCGRVAQLVSGATAACDAACASAACGAALDHAAAGLDAALASVGGAYTVASVRIEGVAKPATGTLRLAEVPQARVVGAYVDAPVVSFGGTARLHQP